MNLTRCTTTEMELWVRDGVPADVGTACEVQDLDIYRVKKLHAEGFDPKVIVDIGGHIGTFTALASKYWPNARIYVFEPADHCIPCLAANLPANAVMVSTCVLGFAGYESGREILPSHPDEQGWRESGKAISFRDVLQMVGGKIDFLKLDCEQSEVNIIREMQELDALRNIEVIHGEWHLPLSRELIKSVLPITHELEIIEGHDRWDTFWARRKKVLPVRTLIYSLAYGAEARRWATIMVQSLRGPGRYRGALRVYSDTDEPIHGAEVIQNIDVCALPRPHLGKAFIGKSMDVSKFDRVMFMDADVVAMEPIAQLLTGDGYYAPVERLCGPNDEGYYSIPHLLAPNGAVGFNSGTLVAPARHWNSMCEMWWVELMHYKPWEGKGPVDQGVFNHLIRTGQFKFTDFLTPAVRFMQEGRPLTYRVPLFHVRGLHKAALMKALLETAEYSIPISVADAADRWSIALLKHERLGHSVDEAYEMQKACLTADPLLIDALYTANGKIWDLESDIRKGKEGELGLEEVGRRALAIRELNAQRIAIKNKIAATCGSFQEVKGNHASAA